MEPESNSDGDEKKDRLPDSKFAEAMKEKAKGKRPMEAKTGNQSTKDDETMPTVETITHKAKGMVIDESKTLKSDTAVETAAKSKGKEVAAGAESKKGKGKQMENVVKRSYSLRSGPKGMDIDVKPTAGKKRKGGELKRLKSSETDTEQGCKGIGKRRGRDDDKDDMEGSSAARTTRSAGKKRRVRSL